ncbi:MAG: hypothetical protein KOO60_06925 [Gemmatimonadales bacterium]|nr:hypothetical protein [Gemmatimonadales bacterium]
MIRRNWFPRLWLFVFLALAAMNFGTVSTVLAEEKCPYQLLQILLPGEEPDPETETGKVGEPLTQMVGVPFQVLVRACKATWETHTNVSHVMLLSSTDDTADLPQVLPMVAGEVTMTVTLNSVGAFTVTATDLTDREHYTATSSVVMVIPTTGIAASLRISDLGPELSAGAPADITIEMVDQNGNRVTSFNAEIDLTQLTSWGVGRMAPETAQMANGVWSGSVTFLLADHARLHAICQTFDPIEGVSNSFDVLPGPYSRLQILLPGQERAPTTAAGLTGEPATQATGYSFSARILATDNYWNLVGDAPLVGLESQDTAATTPLEASLVDGQGVLDVIFGSAGTWNLTVNDQQDVGIESMTSLGIRVLSSTPTFVIGSVPETVTAGVPFTVNITVTDLDGSILTGYNGPTRLTCETGPGSMSPEEIQFSDGTWSGQVILYGANPASAFSCLDYASPPNIGTSGHFEVLPGDFAAVQILLPGESLQGGLDPALAGEPVAQTAGKSLEFEIRAVDSWFNHVPGTDSPVTLTVTDPFADLPDTVQLAAGTATVETTMYRAGTHTILAKSLDNASPSGITPCNSTAFVVSPGSYARLILLAPGEELLSGSETGKIGDPLDQSISYGFDLLLHATDSWWNPRDDVADEIELTVTDPLAELPAAFSLDQGEAVALARLSSGGHQLITATNLTRDDIPPAMTQIRAINSGFHLEAEVNPAQVIAGKPFTLSVAVTNDAGAVMQEINCRVNVKVLNATTGEPGKGKLLNSTFQLRQGRRTVSQTYTGAEPIILEVSDVLDHEPGLSNLILVETGPPNSLQFSSDPPWVGGMKSALVSATVADEFGNGIDNIPVAFSLAEGSGSITPLDEVTNLEGIAQARYTGHSEPELGMVQAAAAGFATELTIATALVDPNQEAGYITNYPNPFHPDEGETKIAYVLSRDAAVTMSYYTLSGTLVFQTRSELGDPGSDAGLNTILWDGINGQGEVVASGGYIVLVEAETDGETIHKMRRRIGVVR